MPGQYDFKKEWEKTRAQLAKFSREAVNVAKKGEKGFIKFSRKSKLHIDTTALSLRKEHLYYLIGKEYAHAENPEKSTPKLAKLMGELNKANKKQLALKRKIQTKKKK